MMTTKFCKAICEMIISVKTILGGKLLKGQFKTTMNNHAKSEKKAYENVNIDQELKRLEGLENELTQGNVNWNQVIQELEKLKKAKAVIGSPVLCMGTGRIYGNTIKRLKELGKVKK